MARIRKAMVLSAGLGTRLRPLTVSTPKPLIPVAGQASLLRTLDTLAHCGIEEVVVNTHYLADQVEGALQQYSGPLTIHISHETHLLETGGGVRQALEWLGTTEPFLVVNGDIVWSEKQTPLLTNLMAQFDSGTMDVKLAVSKIDNVASPRTGGDFVLNEVGQATFPLTKGAADYVYMGVNVMHPRVISSLPKGQAFSLVNIWRDCAAKQKLFAYTYQGKWADMGTPEGLAAANQLMS